MHLEHLYTGIYKGELLGGKMNPSNQFLLRWNDHLCNFAEIFLTLREQAEYVDCTLACEDGLVEAHRIVLGGCSPYFQQLFARISHPHPVIFLTSAKKSIVLLLLEFMYRGLTHVPQDKLRDLLTLGRALRIKGLTMLPSATEGDALEDQDVGHDVAVDVSANEEVNADGDSSTGGTEDVSRALTLTDGRVSGSQRQRVGSLSSGSDTVEGAVNFQVDDESGEGYFSSLAKKEPIEEPVVQILGSSPYPKRKCQSASTGNISTANSVKRKYRRRTVGGEQPIIKLAKLQFHEVNNSKNNCKDLKMRDYMITASYALRHGIKEAMDHVYRRHGKKPRVKTIRNYMHRYSGLSEKKQAKYYAEACRRFVAHGMKPLTD